VHAKHQEWAIWIAIAFSCSHWTQHRAYGQGEGISTLLSIMATLDKKTRRTTHRLNPLLFEDKAAEAFFIPFPFSWGSHDNPGPVSHILHFNSSVAGLHVCKKEGRTGRQNMTQNKQKDQKYQNSFWNQKLYTL